MVKSLFTSVLNKMFSSLWAVSPLSVPTTDTSEGVGVGSIENFIGRLNRLAQKEKLSVNYEQCELKEYGPER